MRPGRTAARWAVTPLILGLLPGIVRAQFTKTITVTPNVTVNAITTWYFANCTTILGVGSYSVDVAPQHGTLSFSGVSGPIPGCLVGSPSLPAVAAFYTWTDTTSGASSDCFQLTYQVNGQSQVDDISVVLIGAPSPPSSASCAAPPPPSPVVITTTNLPDTVSGDAYQVQLTASGGQGPITWSVSAGSLPAGFTLSSNGQLSTTGNPPATPAHYSFTVAATDGHSTASQTLTLAVAPADCTKLFTITPANLGASAIGQLYVTEESKILRFHTEEAITFLGITLGHVDGIRINVGSGVALNRSTPVPIGQVYLAFVQNLTEWSGHATYGTGGPALEERSAALGDNATTPLLDVKSLDNPSIPYYNAPQSIDQTPPVLGDSPDVNAPITDLNNEPLVHINYLKRFTAYLGCYNSYDSGFYPETNLFHFFHPMAVVNWHANYSGAVELSKRFFGGYVFQKFIPDDLSDNGTHVDSKQATSMQPKMSFPPIANGNTKYVCLGATSSGQLCK